MNLSSEEAILITGSPEAVSEVFDCDRCVVIDWKNEVEDTLWAFQCFLPVGFLGYGCPDLAHVEMRAGPRIETVALEPRYPSIPLAERVRQLIAPEHEAWLFRNSVDSDTACYLVRPGAWWQEFRAAYPARFHTLFTETKHGQ